MDIVHVPSIARSVDRRCELGSSGDKGTGMNVTSGSFVRESQTNRYPRRERKS
jgi:hypothetical protein